MSRSPFEEEEKATVHVIFDSKDLSCAICYLEYGLDQNQPFSLACGHTICSQCHTRLQKCPLCQQPIAKAQVFHRSVFISSILKSLKNDDKCKVHGVPYQGFCIQDKTFVCFDCLVDDHRGHHPISKIEEIQKKAKEINDKSNEIHKTHTSKWTEINQSLDEININLKRMIDEKYEKDNEFEKYDIIKKKLYTEVDLTTISDKDRYEHKLLSENLVKYCKRTETVIESWKSKPQENTVYTILNNPLNRIIQELPHYDQTITIIKAEITQKKALYTQELKANLMKNVSFSAFNSSALTIPLKNGTHAPKGYFEVERSYLIDVLSSYGLTGTWGNNNNVLKLRTTPFVKPISLDPQVIGFFSFPKLQVKYRDSPSTNFSLICKILKNIVTLGHLRLELEEITDNGLTSLRDLILKLENLESFDVKMDLSIIDDQSVFQSFLELVVSLKNLSSLTLSIKGFQAIVNFQLTQCVASNQDCFERMTLVFESIPELLTPVFYWLFSSSHLAKRITLKYFKISITGKSTTSSDLASYLTLMIQKQIKLEEFEITASQIIKDSLQSMVLKQLAGCLRSASSLTKLSYKVYDTNSNTPLLLDELLESSRDIVQDLKELTFHIHNAKNLWGKPEALWGCAVEGVLGNFLRHNKELQNLDVKMDGLKLDFFNTDYILDELAKKEQRMKTTLGFVNYGGLCDVQLSHLRTRFQRHPNVTVYFEHPVNMQ